MNACGFIHAHPAAAAAIGMWVLTCFAGALPRPEKTDPKTYKTLFAFVHAVTGSLPRIAATMLPAEYAKFFVNGTPAGGGTAPSSTAAPPAGWPGGAKS